MTEFKTWLATMPELPTEIVDVPEWGRRVHIKALDGGRSARLVTDSHGDPHLRPALLVFLGLADDAGEYLFTGDDLKPEVAADHVRRINRFGFGLIRVAAAIGRLSKLDVEDEDAKKS